MVDEPDRREETASEVTNSLPAEEPPPAEVLNLDHVFDALGHPRRRYLCYTLLESTEWTLLELTTKVAAWERDVHDHEVTDPKRERVYVSLYHAHVPKLVEDGIVAFDESSGRITPAENADQVLAALRGVGATLDAEQERHARCEMDEER